MSKHTITGVRDVPPSPDTRPMDVVRGIVQRSDTAPAAARDAYAAALDRVGVENAPQYADVMLDRAAADAVEPAAEAIRRSLSVTGFDAPDNIDQVMGREAAMHQENVAKQREQDKVRKAREAAGLSGAMLEHLGRERLDR